MLPVDARPQTPPGAVTIDASPRRERRRDRNFSRRHDHP